MRTEITKRLKNTKVDLDAALLNLKSTVDGEKLTEMGMKLLKQGDVLREIGLNVLKRAQSVRDSLVASMFAKGPRKKVSARTARASTKPAPKNSTRKPAAKKSAAKKSKK
jgi:hypothetical protein